MFFDESHFDGAARTGPDREVRRSSGRVRSWPLVVLALPAAVAVWSGWVGIGQMTGFGMVHPLPGIASSVRVDTAITLPLGVEAYAAYALRAWLASGSTVSARTRRFAFWSAIGSFLLGMAGQVAYHLLALSGAVRAPWEVTTLVSCLPVLVLGMGAALAHMIHADQDGYLAGPAGPSHADQEQCTDHDPQDGRTADQQRLEVVRSVADNLAASGRRVSRRTLRAAGLRGSNAELGNIARLFSGGGSALSHGGRGGAGGATPAARPPVLWGARREICQACQGPPIGMHTNSPISKGRSIGSGRYALGSTAWLVFSLRYRNPGDDV
jgi:hypothetical protein